MNDIPKLSLQDMLTKTRASPLFRMTTRDKTLMRDMRYVLQENQTQFWSRFGVSQSSGSRFERGIGVPLPVLMLIRLYLLRVVQDQDLQRVCSSDYELVDDDSGKDEK